jgi:hypothetical protein
MHDYEVLDKVGQSIGNLQALKRLRIANHNYREDDEDLPILDWEILARILSHVRQNIVLVVNITKALAWDAEESRLFARAIHGHPTTTSFVVDRNFPYESLDVLYSTLATLPALESIRLCRRQIRPEDESALSHPESLTELLRVRSLRSVRFQSFDFTPALLQATVNALMEGTEITNLDFKSCSFLAEGSAATMTNGLSGNTSVISITVQCINARALSTPWQRLFRRIRRYDILNWPTTACRQSFQLWLRTQGSRAKK